MDSLSKAHKTKQGTVDKLFHSKTPAKKKKKVKKSRAFAKLLAQQKTMLQQQKQATHANAHKSEQAAAGHSDPSNFFHSKKTAPKAPHKPTATEKRNAKLLARQASMLQVQKRALANQKAQHNKLSARTEAALQTGDSSEVNSLFHDKADTEKAAPIAVKLDPAIQAAVDAQQQILKQTTSKNAHQNPKHVGGDMTKMFKNVQGRSTALNEENAAARRPVKKQDANGLPTWMSPKDVAEILHAKKMQQRVLRMMSASVASRAEAALQVSTEQKRHSVLKMFGAEQKKASAPKQSFRGYTQQDALRFNAATHKAEGKQLGESMHSPVSKKESDTNVGPPNVGVEVSKKESGSNAGPQNVGVKEQHIAGKSPGKESMEARFSQFLKHKDAEWDHLAGKMDQKHILSKMKNEFNKFLASHEVRENAKGKQKGNAKQNKKTRANMRNEKLKFNKATMNPAISSSSKDIAVQSRRETITDPVGESVSQSKSAQEKLNSVSFDFVQTNQAPDVFQDLSRQLDNGV